MALVNFYRGLREKYNPDTHKDGLFFSTDTLEIILNGSSFGGGLTNVEFSEGKLIFSFANGTIKEVPIDEATQDLPGLLSALDKQKLDNLPEGSEITEDITALEQKVGTNDYSGSNYVSESTNVTDAIKELDTQLKTESDTLNQAIEQLDSETIKEVQLDGAKINPADGVVNIPLASQSGDGVMSSEDKTKLDKVIDTGDGTKYLTDNGTYVPLDKNSVGLGNVDNTADLDKPISTATQNALNGKVDKETNKSLVSNDLITKLEGLDDQDTLDAAIADAKKAGTDAAALAGQNKNTIDNYTVNGHKISENPVLTKTDVGLGNVTNEAQIPLSQKGVADGVATLDENGKIPLSQLNGQLARVQGVDEVASSITLPTEGLEVGYMVWSSDDKKFREWNGSDWDVIDPVGDTIYNFRNSDATGSTTRTNILYRWDGENLVEISESLAIGETSGTAYEGNKGKANRDALNTLPSALVRYLDAITKTADNITIPFRFVNKNSGNNQYGSDQNGNVTLPSATTTEAGLLSAADKVKVDGALQRANAGVGVLASYQVAAQAAGITATDTINQAIGKLEKKLNDIAGDGEGSIADQIQEAITALVNGASEGYNTLKELEDAIKQNAQDNTDLEARVATNEGKLAVIQGNESTSGSINKALKDAKDYTDSKLTWTILE